MPTVLNYVENKDSQLPELIDPTETLTAEQCRRWDEELRPQYANLISGSLREVTFTKAIPGIPRRYRAEVQRRFKTDRQPLIVLTSIDTDDAPAKTVDSMHPAPVRISGRTSGGSPTEFNWQLNFLEQLRAFIDQASGEAVGQAGLESVWKELDELHRSQPQALTLTLLAGYITLAEHIASDQEDGSRMSRYAVARWHAKALGAWDLVEQTLTGSAQNCQETDPSAMHSGERAGWIAWLACLCGRNAGETT